MIEMRMILRAIVFVMTMAMVLMMIELCYHCIVSMSVVSATLMSCMFSHVKNVQRCSALATPPPQS